MMKLNQLNSAILINADSTFRNIKPRASFIRGNSTEKKSLKETREETASIQETARLYSKIHSSTEQAHLSSPVFKIKSQSQHFQASPCMPEPSQASSPEPRVRLPLEPSVLETPLKTPLKTNLSSRNMLPGMTPARSIAFMSPGKPGQGGKSQSGGLHPLEAVEVLFASSHPRPRRKPGLLPGFCFQPRDKARHRWQVTQQFAEKVKREVGAARDIASIDLFRFKKSLVSLTSVKKKMLDIKIGLHYHDLPECSMYESRSDDDLKVKTEIDKDEEQSLKASEDADSVPDFKGFDYVMRHRPAPKHCQAIFADLEEGIIGAHYYLITKNTFKYYKELHQFFDKQTRLRILENLRKINTISSIVRVRLKESFDPFPIPWIEPNLLIRNSRMKKYQSMFIQENGRMMSDAIENVSLWDFQINKIFTKDIEIEGLDDFKKIPMELKVPSVRLLRIVFRQRTHDDEGVEEARDAYHRTPRRLTTRSRKKTLRPNVLLNSYSVPDKRKMILKMISFNETNNEFYGEDFKQAHEKILHTKFVRYVDFENGHPTRFIPSQLMSDIQPSPNPNLKSSRTSSQSQERCNQQFLRKSKPMIVLQKVEDLMSEKTPPDGSFFEVLTPKGLVHEFAPHSSGQYKMVSKAAMSTKMAEMAEIARTRNLSFEASSARAKKEMSYDEIKLNVVNKARPKLSVLQKRETAPINSTLNGDFSPRALSTKRQYLLPPDQDSGGGDSVSKDSSPLTRRALSRGDKKRGEESPQALSVSRYSLLGSKVPQESFDLFPRAVS